jgi:hypothetical protein
MKAQKTRQDERRARLAMALRSNLKKRKAKTSASAKPAGNSKPEASAKD